jgi:WD40 repeat protein/TPR repeat protein
MIFRLLLADPRDPRRTATTVLLQQQVLQTSPGGEDIAVGFRPNRSDDLHSSAKAAARLAYRILFREGLVRTQLVVRYELTHAPDNVVGRSSDLLFALALLVGVYESGRNAPLAGGVATLTATGVLESDGTVRAVELVAAKLLACVSGLDGAPATVFFPAENASEVDLAALSGQRPQVRFVPVAHLDEALEHLGIVLERVYLRNPFRGLEHFDYEHRAIFFGRDSEVREVVRQLLRRESVGAPGLLVEGPSGSGKSSFLRAGVLPALFNPRNQPEEVQRAISVRPFSLALPRAIWRPGFMAGIDEADVVRSLQEFWALFPEWTAKPERVQVATLVQLAQAHREHWPTGIRFMWVIDQFEEILNLRLDDTLLEEFGRFLGELQIAGVWTLAAVRADAMPQFKRYEALRRAFDGEGQYYLPTLGSVALDDVIDLPARAADLTFGLDGEGRRLNQLLREEAYREQDSLPLLQFTLNELYLKRSGNELTISAYEQLGGLAGSIATTAEAVLKGDGIRSPQAVPRVFRSLVSVDEAGRATRRYAPMSEIEQNPQRKDLVSRLVAARLCVTDERYGQSVVAFAHDSLLRTLPALIEWLKEEAGLLQTRELAQRDARLWQQNGRSDAWLAAADKLAAFQALDAAEIALPADVRSFIDRSQWHARRATRIKRAAVSLIAALAVVASIGAWIAFTKQREAEYQTSETIRAQARLLTETAYARLSSGDIRGALGIVLEVLTTPRFSGSRTPATISVFQEARAADALLAVLGGYGDRLNTATYSPDGSHILISSYDNTARIWDARTYSEIAVLTGHSGVVNWAAYSPDGTRVVTGSRDSTVRIWDARTGAELLVLSGHSGDVSAVAFSPDGTRVVTAAGDKTARVWDARTGAQLLVISGHAGAVQYAAYSPDGERIVTASDDKSVRIWDARSGVQLMALTGHTDRVYFAAYSPDGTRIASASEDKTARVWDAHNGTQLLVLSGHSTRINSAVFSPDGTRIVTASYDNTARIWDSRSGAQLAVLSGHGAIVVSAEFSPDGTRIVTASDDRTVRIWDARPRGQLKVLSGHEDKVSYVAYSPDGAHIVTTSEDNTARIWDARTGAPLRVLSGHEDRVYWAAYSPDGTRIATASYDKTGRIWDASSGAQLAVLTGHTARVNSIAYSPDGARIVTASYDKTARIWDARSSAQLAVLSGHGDRLRDASYSPDGSRIVTTSYDATARIWNARTGAQLTVLRGHEKRVNSAAYSPDGNRIVTASDDETARIWDARTGAELTELSGHDERVISAEYSPDGRYIVTGGFDRTARVWDARTGVQLAVLSGHGERAVFAAYSPDGTHIATASDDWTAGIWSAKVPAELDAQILWAAAAQSDPLSRDERTRLGLRPDERVRKWGAASKCDEQAAAFYDPDRTAPGRLQESISADVANTDCARETARSGNAPRLTYELGRALLARHDAAAAAYQFELALSRGYAASGVDLANLEINPGPTKSLRPHRAISLYQQAWQAGVPIAAFALGSLYEHGLHTDATAGDPSLQPDLVQAWSWYGKGAAQGEPNALSRLAERDELAGFLEHDLTQRHARLLRAFTLYAAAAGRAHEEDWPDEAWKTWRYRRATLARLLAHEGLMQQVAEAYTASRRAHD